MTNTNFFVEVGNVVRDVGENDYATLSNNNGRLNFVIAVNRSKKRGDEWIDEVSYLDFTCFGKLADNMKTLLRKGIKVCVVGYIKQDRWEKDGQKFSKLNLIAESIELMSKKESNTTAAPGSYSQSENADSEEAFVDEDIPF